MSEENLNQTPDIRTCEECRATYEHEPFYIDASESHDWRAKVKYCEECEKIVNDREYREREELEEKQRQEAREKTARAEWERVVPLSYRETDTSNTNYPRDLHKTAAEWQKGNPIEGKPACLCFGLIGVSSLGKTRALSQLIKRAIWEGKRCEWVNTSKFTRLVQAQFSNLTLGESTPIGGRQLTEGERARRDLERFRTCDILALDDLAKGRLTDTVEASLYDLIEERTSEGRAIVWTSNSSLEDFLGRLSEDRGTPIVRRLYEFSTIIQL